MDRDRSIPLAFDGPPPFAARVAEWARRFENGVLAAFERLLFRRSRRAPERVGVWRVGMIGDTLVALPALEAIRRAHPDAEVVLFTSPGPDGAPGARELLANSPLVDRIVRWSREEQAALGRRGFVAKLATERVDRLYVLPQDRTTPRLELRTMLALRAAGFGDVRGARTTTAHFLPERFARAHDRAMVWPSVAERLVAHVRAHAGEDGARSSIGSRATNDSHATDGAQADHAVENPLALDAACIEAARRALDEVAPGDAPLLCLAPGAKLEHKRWPTTRFGALARRWIDRGGRAVVLGGPGDVELAEAVARTAGVAVPHLCGRTDLLGSAALLADADALVSNDTGTMHLGAAVGTPLVAVFSGWDRRGAWDPWCADPARPPVVLRRPVACSPCVAPSCGRRADGVPACLEIGVDAVEAALERVARRLPQGLPDGRAAAPARAA